MDELSLVLRAIDAGLKVEVQGDKLIVTGPAKHETLAKELLERKAEMLAAFAARGGVARMQGWSEYAREHYLERLGIADDQGRDASAGSQADIIATREAERVIAGLPRTWPATRSASAIDAVIVNFDDARFVRYIDASEVAPVWPETDASRRASNGGHASVDQLHAPTRPENEP